MSIVLVGQSQVDEAELSCLNVYIYIYIYVYAHMSILSCLYYIYSLI